MLSRCSWRPRHPLPSISWSPYISALLFYVPCLLFEKLPVCVLLWCTGEHTVSHSCVSSVINRHVTILFQPGTQSPNWFCPLGRSDWYPPVPEQQDCEQDNVGLCPPSTSTPPLCSLKYWGLSILAPALFVPSFLLRCSLPVGHMRLQEPPVSYPSSAKPPVCSVFPCCSSAPWSSHAPFKCFRALLSCKPPLKIPCSFEVFRTSKILINSSQCSLLILKNTLFYYNCWDSFEQKNKSLSFILMSITALCSTIFEIMNTKIHDRYYSKTYIICLGRGGIWFFF